MPPPFPVIPGYTMLALAGQGGMGSVYKAQQASPQRTVAVKVLSSVNISAEELAAFHREAEVIAHLEHPRIVPLYSYGQQEGVPYLVLRYLGGGSVADRLRSGPLDLATAARWLSGVADALDFAHQKQILHRDIKPSNILLDASGNAYLTDFGIAGTLTTTTASAPVGSAAYMSPEQARGEATDGRADLYALAVTLFEMLTGQKPYMAETALGLIVRHINDPIPSARSLNPAIPPAVDELIQWTMAKDPAARPQSAAEFSRLLQQALAAPNAPLRAGEVAATPTVLGASAAAAAAAPRRGTSPLVWIGGLAVIALCLLGGLAGGGGLLAAVFFAATATPSPAPAASTPTHVSSPTAASTPEGQLLGEDFSNPCPDSKSAGITCGGGRMTNVQQKSIGYWLPKNFQEQLVAITVGVTLPPGPAGSEVGLICRWTDKDNYTAFVINGQGQASIQQNYRGKLTTLRAATTTLHLKSDVPVRLSAKCSGSLSFASGDTILVSGVADPHPVAGNIALMAKNTTSEAITATFQQLVVTQP